MQIDIQEIFDTCHCDAKDNGWWDEYDELTPDEVSSKLCLIHSEVSEALESVRKGEELYWYGKGGKPEGLMAELADVVIRCADLAGYLEVCSTHGLADAIFEKMHFNRTRPKKHGKVI